MIPNRSSGELSAARDDGEATGLDASTHIADDFRQTFHILVVDDRSPILEVLQQYLCDEGFVVTCASDGSSARDILEGGSIDLALIDVVMPGESGLCIADYAERVAVAVILMTGHPESMARLDGSAHRTIQKPFHLKTLSEAIAEVRAARRR